MIEHALNSEMLPPGVASKLARKLSWGCSHMFARFGRAMLRSVSSTLHVLPCLSVIAWCERPLFDQKTKRDGALNPELIHALEWWREVMLLQMRVVRKHACLIIVCVPAVLRVCVERCWFCASANRICGSSLPACHCTQTLPTCTPALMHTPCSQSLVFGTL